MGLHLQVFILYAADVGTRGVVCMITPINFNSVCIIYGFGLMLYSYRNSIAKPVM